MFNKIKLKGKDGSPFCYGGADLEVIRTHHFFLQGILLRLLATQRAAVFSVFEELIEPSGTEVDHIIKID